MKIQLSNIVNIEHTISKNIIINNDIFNILPNLNKYIIELGNSLDKNKYKEIKKNIWIGDNVVLDDNIHIESPCIIDNNTTIKHCAYIRENVIIGKNCVIGNSTEIKNSIIFDNCKLPHFNYVGDSIIGYNSHLGAGAIISNQRLDKKNITISNNDKHIDTKLNKFGAIISDNVEIGCNSVIQPGTIINSNTIIYPLVVVKGIISQNSIIKK